MKSRLWFAPPEVIPRFKTSRAGASSSGALPPVDPPAGAYVWLDANALTGANGAPVPSWVDSGSSGFPATDAGMFTPPTLALDFDGNGNQGVNFDGSQALGWIAGTLDFTGVAGITVCGVWISAASAGANILSSFQTRPWGVFWDTVDELGVFTTLSAVSSGVFPNAELLAWEMQQPRDGSDVPRFWKNGGTSAGAGGSFLLSVEDSPVGTVLGQNIGGGSFLGAVIGDFLIYKRQFDAADRAQWAAFIASKYGL